MKFYHGTTTALHIEKEIIPPVESGVLREEWRKKLTTKVFFTTSTMSAYKFAKKAATKYGGEPIVYEVEPIGDVWHINTNEYIADKAKIIKEIQ